MKTYYVTNERTRQRTHRLGFVGGAEQIRVDYSSWAEDNGAPSTVVATVSYGDAAISVESLTASVKTMTVTASNSGKTLIKLTATAGTNIDVSWLELYGADPTLEFNDDYGMA
ncbi:MAG: hypothetical protein Q8R92_20340 [Deltaproteobacteria bacterium]|nr:hypothetical protein [Deltaproteobacteria bacterium]